MKYLWTEDTGAGLHFWKLVNQLLFNNGIIELICQRLMTRRLYSIWLVLRDILQSG